MCIRQQVSFYGTGYRTRAVKNLVDCAAVIVIVVRGLTDGLGTLANGINNAKANVGTYINQVIG